MATAIGETCADMLRRTTLAFEKALPDRVSQPVTTRAAAGHDNTPRLMQRFFTTPSPVSSWPHLGGSVCVQGEEVKALFGVDGGMWDPDFFYMLADSAAMADQVRHWPSQSY